MVLKTRGLGTGTTFMRGSYIRVVEPRLLAWLRERTVLVKSEQELYRCTTGSEYTENILIFAFAAQSSLSKVRNVKANVGSSKFTGAFSIHLLLWGSKVP